MPRCASLSYRLCRAAGACLLAAALGGCETPRLHPREPVPLSERPPNANTPHRLPDANLPPRFQRYSIADGLTSGFVKGLLQDEQGFLWIATADGLNRFDGATIVEYYHEPAVRGSLSQNSTNRLLLDASGRIWIGHSGGVDRFDPATETFTHFRTPTPDPTESSSVYGLALDASWTVWVGASNGRLSRFDPKTGVLTPVSWAEGPRSIVALAPEPDGTLWLGGSDGLYHYDPARDSLVADPIGAASINVFALHRDRAGTLWIGTEGDGLYHFDPTTGTLRHYAADAENPQALGDSWVLTISEDTRGTVWVGTNGGGLARYVPQQNAFKRYTFDASDPSSLSNDYVTAILEDRTGVLWVGTTSGLNRRLPLSAVIERHRHRPGDPTSLRSNEVRSFVEEPDGTLWVGTRTGLDRRDPGTNTFTRSEVAPGGRAAIDTEVFALALDSTGTVWAGAKGLFRKVNGRFTRVPLPGYETATTALSASPEGRLWIGAGDLLALDVSQGEPRSAGAREQRGAVMEVLAGPGGTVDVATYGRGLYRLGPEGQVLATWRHDPDDEHSLSSDLVTVLHRDGAGSLWVGTNQGLDRIDARGRRTAVIRYGRAEGLPHPTVHGIAHDASGYIWVSTNRGLSRLDPATGTFLTYHAADGLESDAAYTIYQSPRTGRLFVGSDHGYVSFDPAALPEESPPEPVVLTGLRLFDEHVHVAAEGSPLPLALAMLHELRLGPSDDVITVTFAALDYRAPAQHRYAVQLDGLDAAWLDMGGRREATFTALPPGRYTLRVRAAGRDGQWGAPSAPLTLLVAPPWWRTWWAYVLYVLVGGGGLFSLARHERNRVHLHDRLHVEHRETEKLRDLDHTKSRFFANVSHEFRTPLTLTLGPLDDLLEDPAHTLPPAVLERLRMARRNARRLLDLVNELLDVAKLEAGRLVLQKQPHDLSAFVGQVARAYAALAERQGLTFHVTLTEGPLTAAIDAQQLEKAIGNLLSNALKFTPRGGTVSVRLTAMGSEGDGQRAYARLDVADTGPGIPPDEVPFVFDRFHQVNETTTTLQPGTGIGLALARELADLHGGALTVTSAVGVGTTFSLLLPLDDVPPEESPTWKAWIESHAAARVEILEDRLLGAAVPDDDASGEADRTTVLVVEDNAEVRAYLATHLTAAYRVLEARDGQEGLDLAREALPDLIIADVMMPRLDGIALCHALKHDPATDFIPLILLTARAGLEAKLEGLETGADDYVVKPFDAREVLARVDNLITSRRMWRTRHVGAAATEDVPAPPATPAPSAEAVLHAQLLRLVEIHAPDPDFGVAELAREMEMTRASLYRLLKELGQTPSEMIWEARLAQAMRLLREHMGTVSEVAYGTGFKSVSHFSRRFHDRFGMSPSEVRRAMP